MNETAPVGGGLAALAHQRRILMLASVVALALLAACARAEPIPLSPGHWVDRSGTYSITLDGDGDAQIGLPLDALDPTRECGSPNEVPTLHETGMWMRVGGQVLITLPQFNGLSISILDSGRQDDWSEIRYYPCFLETPIVMVKDTPKG